MQNVVQKFKRYTSSKALRNQAIFFSHKIQNGKERQHLKNRGPRGNALFQKSFQTTPTRSRQEFVKLH